MLVRSATGTVRRARRSLDREGVLMVKFTGKFVPTKQDEPFDQRKSTGKIKQDLSHFRNVSKGKKMYAVTGNIRSG